MVLIAYCIKSFQQKYRVIVVIVNIIKSILNNMQRFIVIWVVVILVNQIFIFGACFAPYCLIAALPHTGVIASLIHFFSTKKDGLND